MSKKAFNINSEIYSKDSIIEAISSFTGYNISYDNEIISIDDEDPQYVFDELMNYSLSISLENILWA